MAGARFSIRRNPVAPVAGSIVLLVILVGVVFPDAAASNLHDTRKFVLETFGWFYLLVVGVLVSAVLFMAFSRLGDLKLGAEDREPDYPYLSWLAMLIIAGLGIGLLYYGATEPLLFYSAPSSGEPRSVEAARQAMALVFFHWGFHAWAIYATVGLSLAYFSFRHDLPLSVRSGLYPLIGRHINGPVGHAVDILSVLGTLFGIATALGLGVLQINAGLNRLWAVPETSGIVVALAVVLTIVAVLIMATRMNDVIRRLSQINLGLVVALLLFVLAFGSTQFLLHAFVQNFGGYLDGFVERTFGAHAYEQHDRLEDWTLYYWAGWIAWSPFVGVFIAQISRGRTVREFVLGVLLVPTIFTCFWLTVLGNSAISFDMSESDGTLSEGARANYGSALFLLLEQMPGSRIMTTLTIMLVVLTFIITAHSGAMVVDTMVAGSTAEAPAWRRIGWCALQGFVVVALLPTGGFDVLYGVSGISALVFSLVLFFLIVGLIVGMRAQLREREEAAFSRAPSPEPATWQKRLAKLLHQHRREDVDAFIEQIVWPALKDVSSEIGRRGLTARVERTGSGGIRLYVRTSERDVFVYEVSPENEPAMVFSPSEATSPDDRRQRVWKAYASQGEGSSSYDILGLDYEAVIFDVLERFGRR